MPSKRSAIFAEADLSTAIEGRIQPVRIRASYRLALVGITLAMVLLMAVYVALIGLIVVLIGMIYVKTGFAALTLQGTWGSFLLFFMPGLVGCFVIGFMLKPIFAKHARPTPVVLQEAEQPELYAYVRRLCAIVGAPSPTCIQIDCRANASASFHEGRKGLMQGKLVLTVGIPLAAGLTMREFTGVLAHEFGHFAQGTGMRLTYIVRTINYWFYCAVYEWDMWDVFFARARHGSSAFFLGGWMAKPLAGFTRCIIRVLMWIGNMVSAAMLRQMEFDADRYEARVAGSDAFEKTMDRLEALALAEKEATDEVHALCRKGRVCDDFNRLVLERETTTTPEARLAGLKRLRLLKGETEWFDTHPCHKERVASAKRENAVGIFRGEGNARDLFRDFDALSKRASELYYRKDLGIQYDSSHVVSTDSMLAGSDDHHADLRLLTRFFQGLLNPIYPIFPEIGVELPGNPAVIAEQMDAARRRLLELGELGRAALAHHDSTDKQSIGILRTQAIGQGYLYLGRSGINVSCEPDATSFNAAAMQGMRRINLAMAATRGEASNSGDAVIDALLAFRRAAPALEQLRRSYFALDSALTLSQSDNRGDSIRGILGHAETTQAHLQEIRTILDAAAYPYGHAGRTTLSQYAIGRVPGPNEIGAVHTTSQAALKSLYNLYVRLVGDLARRTEAFEASLGLGPLADPPNSEQDMEKLRSRYDF